MAARIDVRVAAQDHGSAPAITMKHLLIRRHSGVTWHTVAHIAPTAGEKVQCAAGHGNVTPQYQLRHRSMTLMGVSLVDGAGDSSRGRDGVLEGTREATRNKIPACADDLDRASLSNNTWDIGADGVVATIVRGPRSGGGGRHCGGHCCRRPEKGRLRWAGGATG